MQRSLFYIPATTANAADRSSTGKPLLMGEFHMEVGQIPPILYAMHVELEDSGEWFHGVTVPGLPSLAAGRNAHVGFSYTFGHAANVDFWVEQVEDGHVLTGERRDKLTRRVEEVRVKGRTKPEWWTYWEGARGTIVGDAMRKGVLPGMRWRGMSNTAADMEALLQMPFARTVGELVELNRRVKFASFAGTFVDVHGRIAYCHTGTVRETPDEWGPKVGWTQGEAGDMPDLPEKGRPVLFDPASGFIASANEGRRGWTGFEEPSYRHDRLGELLGGDGTLSPEDLLRVSYDERDLMAARLMPAFAAAVPEDPAMAELARWAEDQPVRQTRAGHTQMQRFHALHFMAVRNLFARRFGRETAAWMAANPAVILGLQFHIDEVLAGEHPDLLDDTERQEILREAWVELESTPELEAGIHTPKIREWRFKNPITSGRSPEIFGIDSPPIELPGGPTCLFQTRISNVWGTKLLTGPAFPLLIDMSTDVTRYNLAGGASERWRGPGYAAGLEDWRTGGLGELRAMGHNDG